jgi:hypothetical protein
MTISTTKRTSKSYKTQRADKNSENGLVPKIRGLRNPLARPQAALDLLQNDA